MLNASGQVAFFANTSVSGSGIFAGTPGSTLTTAALQGTAAPNCGGATFSTFGLPTLNASGQVAFLATTSISGNGFKNLEEGQPVEFELVDSPKGPKASNVTAK